MARTGVSISDGDGKDFEGVTIPEILTLKGISIRCLSGIVDMTSNSTESGTITAGETRAFTNNSGIPSFVDTSVLNEITFTAVTNSEITLTVVGSTI